MATAAEPTRPRGKLRVYLGAAPGVGKTYAMLGEGRRRAERGTDVVVGFVETHGRQHTAEMVEGLEVVPRRTLAYRELVVRGDGPRRRARAPTRGSPWSTSSPTPTSPASRNAKRWQDVEELLDAGIDVITTVNIQHLESVNDVVEKITGVPQRETVPDAVVRAADQIELEDMTAEALRRRLAHGNVYAAGEGRRRAGQLLPGRATSTRCASWRCCGPPTGSTPPCSSTASSTRSPASGRRASAWSWH